MVRAFGMDGMITIALGVGDYDLIHWIFYSIPIESPYSKTSSGGSSPACTSHLKHLPSPCPTYSPEQCVVALQFCVPSPNCRHTPRNANSPVSIVSDKNSECASKTNTLLLLPS